MPEVELKEPETIGGQTTVTCWRCGAEIKENESIEQHPEGRSHQLQQCFDVVNGQLNEVKAKAKEEIKGPAPYSLDEDEEAGGKSKKK